MLVLDIIRLTRCQLEHTVLRRQPFDQVKTELLFFQAIKTNMIFCD